MSLDNQRELSDLEIALGWIHEMRNPCSDPKNPELNMLESWTRESKNALEMMKDKPAGEQNKGAIKLLEDEIKISEQKLREREGSGEIRR